MDSDTPRKISIADDNYYDWLKDGKVHSAWLKDKMVYDSYFDATKYLMEASKMNPFLNATTGPSNVTTTGTTGIVLPSSLRFITRNAVSVTNATATTAPMFSIEAFLGPLSGFLLESLALEKASETPCKPTEPEQLSLF